MLPLSELKRYLLEKKYRPGEKIATEMELANHFQVSRNKIREATTTLCQLGILEKKARRGTVLKAIDADSIGSDLRFRFALADFNPADFMEARRVIEKAILPLAIKRISPVMLAELEKAVLEMKKNLAEPEAADAADRRFHLILLQACGNRTLQAFGQVIQTLFRKENRRRFWTTENFTAACDDHLRLIEAVRNGDTDTATAIMDRHFKS